MSQTTLTTTPASVTSTMATTTTTTATSTRSPVLEMQVANLGDSGLLVIKNQNGEIVYRTTEQHHYFNCPYQLGTSTDTPDDAFRGTLLLHAGALVTERSLILSRAYSSRRLRRIVRQPFWRADSGNCR